MTRDLQPRDLDMTGRRIANLGDPVEPHDATKTDNTTVPRRASLQSAPGVSLLASPADHVHPLPGDLLLLSDPALQIVDTTKEIWFGVIDFDSFVGDQFLIGLSGMLQACVVQAWLDGQIGSPFSGTLVANIESISPTLVPITGVTSEPFPRPSGAHLLKLVTDPPLNPTAEGRTLGRLIMLRGLF